MNPKKIIVEDEDGGYYIAEYVTTQETPDEVYIPIYKTKEYYHDLESALRDI